MSIRPINGHVLIEPVKHESFIASQKETYQEIGVVVDVDADCISNAKSGGGTKVKAGDKVLFDAWLGKKFPKEGTDDFYWLIKGSDIVAYEAGE